MRWLIEETLAWDVNIVFGTPLLSTFCMQIDFCEKQSWFIEQQTSYHRHVINFLEH